MIDIQQTCLLLCIICCYAHTQSGRPYVPQCSLLPYTTLYTNEKANKHPQTFSKCCLEQRPFQPCSCTQNQQNKNIISIAGYDEQIYQIIKDIQIKNIRKDVTIIFYLYQNSRLRYLGNLMTSLQIFEKVLKKYHHYFCINEKNINRFHEANSAWCVNDVIIIPSIKESLNLKDFSTKDGDAILNEDGGHDQLGISQCNQDNGYKSFVGRLKDGINNVKYYEFNHPSDAHLISAPINVQLKSEEENHPSCYGNINVVNGRHLEANVDRICRNSWYNPEKYQESHRIPIGNINDRFDVADKSINTINNLQIGTILDDNSYCKYINTEYSDSSVGIPNRDSSAQPSTSLQPFYSISEPVNYFAPDIFAKFGKAIDCYSNFKLPDSKRQNYKSANIKIINPYKNILYADPYYSTYSPALVANLNTHDAYDNLNLGLTDKYVNRNLYETVYVKPKKFKINWSNNDINFKQMNYKGKNCYVNLDSNVNSPLSAQKNHPTINYWPNSYINFKPINYKGLNLNLNLNTQNNHPPKILSQNSNVPNNEYFKTNNWYNKYLYRPPVCKYNDNGYHRPNIQNKYFVDSLRQPHTGDNLKIAFDNKETSLNDMKSKKTNKQAFKYENIFCDFPSQNYYEQARNVSISSCTRPSKSNQIYISEGTLKPCTMYETKPLSYNDEFKQNPNYMFNVLNANIPIYSNNLRNSLDDKGLYINKGPNHYRSGFALSPTTQLNNKDLINDSNEAILNAKLQQMVKDDNLNAGMRPVLLEASIIPNTAHIYSSKVQAYNSPCYMTNKKLIGQPPYKNSPNPNPFQNEYYLPRNEFDSKSNPTTKDYFEQNYVPRALLHIDSLKSNSLAQAFTYKFPASHYYSKVHNPFIQRPWHKSTDLQVKSTVCLPTENNANNLESIAKLHPTQVGYSHGITPFIDAATTEDPLQYNSVPDDLEDNEKYHNVWKPAHNFDSYSHIKTPPVDFNMPQQKLLLNYKHIPNVYPSILGYCPQITSFYKNCLRNRSNPKHSIPGVGTGTFKYSQNNLHGNFYPHNINVNISDSLHSNENYYGHIPLKIKPHKHLNELKTVDSPRNYNIALGNPYAYYNNAKIRLTLPHTSPYSKFKPVQWPRIQAVLNNEPTLENYLPNTVSFLDTAMYLPNRPFIGNSFESISSNLKSNDAVSNPAFTPVAKPCSGFSHITSSSVSPGFVCSNKAYSKVLLTSNAPNVCSSLIPYSQNHSPNNNIRNNMAYENIPNTITNGIINPNVNIVLNPIPKAESYHKNSVGFIQPSELGSQNTAHFRSPSATLSLRSLYSSQIPSYFSQVQPCLQSKDSPQTYTSPRSYFKPFGLVWPPPTLNYPQDLSKTSPHSQTKQHFLDLSQPSPRFSKLNTYYASLSANTQPCIIPDKYHSPLLSPQLKPCKHLPDLKKFSGYPDIVKFNSGMSKLSNYLPHAFSYSLQNPAQKLPRLQSFTGLPNLFENEGTYNTLHTRPQVDYSTLNLLQNRNIPSRADLNLSAFQKPYKTGLRGSIQIESKLTPMITPYFYSESWIKPSYLQKPITASLDKKSVNFPRLSNYKSPELSTGNVIYSSSQIAHRLPYHLPKQPSGFAKSYPIPRIASSNFRPLTANWPYSSLNASQYPSTITSHHQPWSVFSKSDTSPGILSLATVTPSYANRPYVWQKDTPKFFPKSSPRIPRPKTVKPGSFPSWRIVTTDNPSTSNHRSHMQPIVALSKPSLYSMTHGLSSNAPQESLFIPCAQPWTKYNRLFKPYSYPKQFRPIFGNTISSKIKPANDRVNYPSYTSRLQLPSKRLSKLIELPRLNTVNIKPTLNKVPNSYLLNFKPYTGISNPKFTILNGVVLDRNRPRLYSCNSKYYTQLNSLYSKPAKFTVYPGISYPNYVSLPSPVTKSIAFKPTRTYQQSYTKHLDFAKQPSKFAYFNTVMSKPLATTWPYSVLYGQKYASEHRKVQSNQNVPDFVYPCLSPILPCSSPSYHEYASSNAGVTHPNSYFTHHPSSFENPIASGYLYKTLPDCISNSLSALVIKPLIQPNDYTKDLITNSKNSGYLKPQLPFNSPAKYVNSDFKNKHNLPSYHYYNVITPQSLLTMWPYNTIKSLKDQFLCPITANQHLRTFDTGPNYGYQKMAPISYKFNFNKYNDHLTPITVSVPYKDANLKYKLQYPVTRGNKINMPFEDELSNNSLKPFSYNLPFNRDNNGDIQNRQYETPYPFRVGYSNPKISSNIGTSAYFPSYQAAYYKHPQSQKYEDRLLVNFGIPPKTLISLTKPKLRENKYTSDISKYSPKASQSKYGLSFPSNYYPKKSQILHLPSPNINWQSLQKNNQPFRTPYLQRDSKRIHPQQQYLIGINKMYTTSYNSNLSLNPNSDKGTNIIPHDKHTPRIESKRFPKDKYRPRLSECDKITCVPHVWNLHAPKIQYTPKSSYYYNHQTSVLPPLAFNSKTFNKPTSYAAKNNNDERFSIYQTQIYSQKYPQVNEHNTDIFPINWNKPSGQSRNYKCEFNAAQTPNTQQDSNPSITYTNVPCNSQVNYPDILSMYSRQREDTPKWASFSQTTAPLVLTSKISNQYNGESPVLQTPMKYSPNQHILHKAAFKPSTVTYNSGKLIPTVNNWHGKKYPNCFKIPKTMKHFILNFNNNIFQPVQAINTNTGTVTFNPSKTNINQKSGISKDTPFWDRNHDASVSQGYNQVFNFKPGWNINCVPKINADYQTPQNIEQYHQAPEALQTLYNPDVSLNYVSQTSRQPHSNYLNRNNFYRRPNTYNPNNIPSRFTAITNKPSAVLKDPQVTTGFSYNARIPNKNPTFISNISPSSVKDSNLAKTYPSNMYNSPKSSSILKMGSDINFYPCQPTHSIAKGFAGFTPTSNKLSTSPVYTSVAGLANIRYTSPCANVLQLPSNIAPSTNQYSTNYGAQFSPMAPCSYPFNRHSYAKLKNNIPGHTTKPQKSFLIPKVMNLDIRIPNNIDHLNNLHSERLAIYNLLKSNPYNKIDNENFKLAETLIKDKQANIEIGNVCLVKQQPDGNSYIIPTNNPKIYMKAWKCPIKVIKAKIVLDESEYNVMNFMPVVKESNIFDFEAVQNVVKDIVKQTHGDPIVLKGVYKMLRPYSVVCNIDSIKLNSGACVLWPTFDESII